MSGLLGPNGAPISSKDFDNKKEKPPALGEQFGRWAGDQVPSLAALPGGGAFAFDTSLLDLSDFRQMKSHYQINSSLSVLTFMLHQMEWHIECDDKKMKDFLEDSIGNIWSRLVRAMSQALWAGYSPNVIQWENDVDNRAVVIDKVKDLIPEDCRVHWKQVQAPGHPERKFPVYDGITQFGSDNIPVANSFWYPLLMEHGNYYGRRLLESAFQPWFFSSLMHLFANRYYERFGEPVPVGRAPYDEEINVNGKTVYGNKMMEALLTNLRNRSVVVLPSDKTKVADNDNNPDFDYQIEYLESQMRGADFERYMTRLDEEMSLAMFTPILMMRTADVGSYNLGTQHTQVYLWMLNAISGDWAFYINKYIVRPLNYYNSSRGSRAPEAKLKFAKMGKVDSQLLQAIVTQLLTSDKVKLDPEQIGEMAGLTMTEIKEVTQPDQQDPNQPDPAPAEDPPPSQDGTDAPADVARRIVTRVSAQARRAFNEVNGPGKFAPELSHKRQMENAIELSGFSNSHARAGEFFRLMNHWTESNKDLCPELDSAMYMKFFGNAVDSILTQVLK